MIVLVFQVQIRFQIRVFFCRATCIPLCLSAFPPKGGNKHIVASGSFVRTFCEKDPLLICPWGMIVLVFFDSSSNSISNSSFFLSCYVYPPFAYRHFPQREETSTFWLLDHLFGLFVKKTPFNSPMGDDRAGFSSSNSISNSSFFLSCYVYPPLPIGISPKGRKQAHFGFWIICSDFL
jgi:hypothetical protein